MIRIRMTEPEDLPALLEIYNEEVLNTTSTLDLYPKGELEWAAYLAAHNKDNHPMFTAELDGRIAGYACLSSYRDKEAFAGTVELSIYIAAPCRGKGVARALMDSLLDIARSDPATLTVVSVITADNEASIRLHERYGFRFCGSIPAAAEKFGRLLAVETYALWVGPGAVDEA